MATIEIPSPSALDVPLGIMPATVDVENLEQFGINLEPPEYLMALRSIIGHGVLVSTVSTEFVSPLRYTLPFRPEAIKVDMYYTRLTHVGRRTERTENLRFLFDHSARLGTTKPVEAIAPVDPTISHIYLLS